MSKLLTNDEWILFQIKEGPCSIGCKYCYERAYIKNNKSNLEFSIFEFEKYIKILKKAGINRMALSSSSKLLKKGTYAVYFHAQDGVGSYLFKIK